MKQKREREFTRDQLLEVLGKLMGHTKDNPIHSKSLYSSPSTGRFIVSALRNQGYPICSNADGYYLASNAGEFNESILNMERLIKGMQTTLAKMKETYIVLQDVDKEREEQDGKA